MQSHACMHAHTPTPPHPPIHTTHAHQKCMPRHTVHIQGKYKMYVRKWAYYVNMHEVTSPGHTHDKVKVATLHHIQYA